MRIIRVAAPLCLAFLVTACSGTSMDDLLNSFAKFLSGQATEPEPKEAKPQSPEKIEKKQEAKKTASGSVSQLSKPKTHDTTDPNEEFKKKLTGGIEVTWDKPGTIMNRNAYPVKIKKILVIGLSRTELRWDRKNGTDFGPAEGNTFLETNVEFEIYHLSGSYIETKKPPQK